LDLEAFFPSVNFGRVRGFFINDNRFRLSGKAATVVAQIACHNNELPQGSPCSPVISNLIAHMLDVRLARLAKRCQVTYSRYADDLTFSTNRKIFPDGLAHQIDGNNDQYTLGRELLSEIDRAGFSVNPKKTRLQFRDSRQLTTGLMVNSKVNIKPEYYRMARAMCHALFTAGTYYKNVPTNLVPNACGESRTVVHMESLAVLEGILNHIHYVKDQANQKLHENSAKRSQAPRDLYRKFLFFKNFVALQEPLLIPEGKTDSIYLRSAIARLTNYHPRLGQHSKGGFSCVLRFLNYSPMVHEILKLGNGASSLVSLISNYRNTLKTFSYSPLLHPVIVLADNDSGANQIFGVAKKYGHKDISHEATEPFYRLCANLYLVKTPEIGKNGRSCIEDMFEKKLFETSIGGKTFDPNKKHRAAGKYGKQMFAEKVVRPSMAHISFSGFAPLLDRIVAVMDHYEKILTEVTNP
jgi:hypothetical protein